MKHEDFRQKLDRYVDGELSAEEARRLEEHLASCAECSGELSRLGALLDQASALRERVVMPKHELWPGVLERIRTESEPSRADARGTDAGRAASGRAAPGSAEAGGVRAAGIGETDRSRASLGRRRERRAFGLAQLFRGLSRGRLPYAWAAAAGAAVLLIWVLANPPARSPEASVAGLATIETETSRARSDLNAALAQSGGQMPAGSDFEKNLKLLDDAIKDSRAALEADPRNQGLQRSILIVYQKQLDLLRWATRLVQQT